jgi:UDP-glucose 4-epimerase
MKVLITGANGFLGSRTVTAFRRRGHEVRALVRPATKVERLNWHEDPGIEVVRGDLRTAKNLAEHARGVDAVVHLAAVVAGADDDMLASSVVGTERLLAAMNEAGVKRLVLCSSFSVYNYRKIRPGGELTEATPLLDHPDLYQRNGYSVAKTWQERLARRWAEERGGQLTVLRPGFIWGPGHEYQPCLGGQIGPLHTIMGPGRKIALTYVENCADAFAAATVDERAIGETFNVVDDEEVTALGYARTYLKEMNPRGVAIPVPYALGFGFAWLATKTSKTIFRGKGKLPGIFVPHKVEPRFKPYRVSKDKLSRLLGWQQPVTYEEALRRTYAPLP